MSQAYYNQQLSQGTVPDFNAHNGSQSTVVVPVMTIDDPVQTDEQQWKHLLSKIRPEFINRLHIVAAFYIVLGVTGFVFECFLTFDLYTGIFAGFVNGVFLFLVGITTLVLCRQEVYALTNLTVLLIFQLLCTLVTIGIYSYGINIYNSGINSCSTTDPESYCNRIGKAVKLLIANVVIHIITFITIIFNFIIISSARQPPEALIRPAYIQRPTNIQSPPLACPYPYIPPSGSSIES